MLELINQRSIDRKQSYLTINGRPSSVNREGTVRTAFLLTFNLSSLVGWRWSNRTGPCFIAPEEWYHGSHYRQGAYVP